MREHGSATDGDDQDASIAGLLSLVQVQGVRIGELERQLEIVQARLRAADTAIVTRDIIGVAKGIIVATTGRDPEAAFELLVEQSHHQHVKVRHVAEEIISRTTRRV